MATQVSIVLNVAEPERAARFWSAALGYDRSERTPGLLSPPGAAGPSLYLDTDDRTHLDLWAADRDDQQAEVRRLEALGARRVEDWPYAEGADHVVLTDPEGNLFCVVYGSGD